MGVGQDSCGSADRLSGPDPARHVLERLGAHQDVSEFASGKEELDSWLRRHALAAQQIDSARTFLLTRGADDTGNRVAGYFSLTMSSVLRAEAPPKLVRGLPAYPVGMVLLARLAVDRSEQGRKGLGALLLSEALRKAVAAGEPAAARLVVVGAIDDEAAKFCAHHGFIPAPGHPCGFTGG
jgi:predicted N-acetyltransferase YhbS